MKIFSTASLSFLVLSLLFQPVLAQNVVSRADLNVTQFTVSFVEGMLHANVSVKNISAKKISFFSQITVLQTNARIVKFQGKTFPAPAVIWVETQHPARMLMPQETVTMQFNFLLSHHLQKDDFLVRFEAVDSFGTNTITFDQQTVAMQGDGSWLEFNQDTCNIVASVNGKEMLFYPQSAPPFNPNETPKAVCEVTNTSNNSITAHLSLLVNVLRAFGNLQTQSEVVDGGPYTFAAKETKTITIMLPEKSKPQVYEAAAQFVGDGHDIYSELVPLRWTVKGMSGRIDSWTVTKTMLRSGNVRIDIRVNYYGSMDLYWQQSENKIDGFSGTPFEGVELSATAFQSGSGTSCATSHIDLPRSDSVSVQSAKISLKLSKMCGQNPTIHVNMVRNADVLSQIDVPLSDLSFSASEKGRASSFVIAGVGVIFLISLFFIANRLRKKHA